MALPDLKLAIAVCVAALCLEAGAVTNDSSVLEPVRAQLRVKNFTHAVDLLRPIADAGNAQAELLLANLYRHGLGVDADAVQTEKYLTRAAQHGDPQAMYELAAMLADAETPDHALIQQWLQRAAQAGHALAIQAVREHIEPQQFQPEHLLTDANARRAAFWLAASRDDVAQLQAFNDTALLNASDEFGRTALAYAARRGAARASAWLLQSGANSNQADSFGVTPLMLAASASHVAVLDQLIKAGVHANLQDKSGNNALMYAISKRHADCINALLPITDLKQRNAQNWSVLDWAIRSNDNALATRLRGMGLESSRKVAVTSSKPNIPLQHASSNDLYRGWPDVLIASTRSGTELFDAVVQTNSSALRGNETAALLAAVQSGNAALIDKLLARGISVATDSGETPLSWAVRHGKSALVQQLLAAGLKPDVHGKNETAPLFDVARMKDASALDMMNALLKAGANTDLRDRLGRTALIVSVQSQQTALTERLLQSGANSEVADNSGHTALMYAVIAASDDTVQRLVTNRAALDARDKDGNTALMLAAAAGNASAVNTLVAAGASTLGNKSGVTALMLAAANGQEDLVKKLLNAGMKADAQDKHGDTALIYGARGGQLATVRALLAAGADTGLRNNDRASARDVAERLAFKDVTAALAQRS